MMRRLFLRIFAVAFLFPAMTVSCLNWEDVNDGVIGVPSVTIHDVNNCGLKFLLHASLSSEQDAGRMAECGFYISGNKNFKDAERIECKPINGLEWGAEVTLTEYEAVYYACAYISKGDGSVEICSDYKTIQTKAFQDYVTLGQVSVLSYDKETEKAEVKVSCEIEYGVDITSAGLCYGSSEDIDIDGDHIEQLPDKDNAIVVELSEIGVASEIWLRPYICSGEKVAYGASQSVWFTEFPMVSTDEVTSVTDHSAVCNGLISSDGGGAIVSRGFIWGESPELSMELETKVDLGTGDDSFSYEITGLDYETDYYVCAYATNQTGTSYGEAKKFTTLATLRKDLSENGRANCYIVSRQGQYKFPSCKGNGADAVDGIKSVSVLWESFGTSEAPQVGDLISSVSYSDGYVFFETSQTFKTGNAVIAVKGSFDEVLWSWHLWFTDEPQLITYRNVEKKMMDRNLGATSAEPGEGRAFGLLYQWGRKDPFLGFADKEFSKKVQSTVSWPSNVGVDYNRGTVAYAVEHPTTFLTSDSNWCMANTGNLWASLKTIYDPCPPGWRVPDGGSSGVWAKTGLDINEYDFQNRGKTFATGYCSPSTWYPETGYISRSGSIHSYDGLYWSVTTSTDEYSYCLRLNEGNTVSPSYHMDRANALSVRCIQE